MNRSSFVRALTRVVVLVLPISLATASFAPANAVPNAVGDYASVSATVVRQVAPDECRNVADRVYTLNLQGLGAEIEAQGYSLSNGNPVYTALEVRRDTRITGPGNFFGTGYEFISFPTSQFRPGLELCPEDFDGGKVLPGTYTFETTLTADTGYRSLCSAAEGCHDYEVYKRVLTYSIVVTAEVNQACVSAKGKLASLKAKLKTAKKKASNNPTLANRKKVQKFKSKVANAKATVQSVC